MAKTSPIEFVQQVRREASKVTWPTRKETMISTGMVLVFVTIAALFFFATDSLISLAIQAILGLGS